MRSNLRFFTICWGLCLILFAPLLRSSVDTSFVAHLFQKTPPFLEKHDDTPVNKMARRVWHDMAVKGYCVRESSDKVLRPVFSQIQYHLEEQLFAINETFPMGTSFWVVHTPTIATPLVTNGKVDSKLMSDKNLKDKTSLQIVSKRAALMRRYLAKGGILVVSYHENSDSAVARTPQQMAIFDTLKKEFPKQIIVLPIRSKVFPLENIGATYLVKSPTNEIIAITLRGVQLNDSQEKETWGVWIAGKPKESNIKLTDNIQFLMRNGLKEALTQHAHQQGMAKEDFIAIFKRL